MLKRKLRPNESTIDKGRVKSIPGYIVPRVQSTDLISVVLGFHRLALKSQLFYAIDPWCQSGFKL